LATFKDDLTQIVTKYPDDKLITPLIKQHLAYVDAHQAEMQGEFALTNNDPNEVPVSVIAPTPVDAITAYNNSQLVQQVAQQRIDPLTKKPEVIPGAKAPEATKTEATK